MTPEEEEEAAERNEVAAENSKRSEKYRGLSIEKSDGEFLGFFACFRDRQHLPAQVRVLVDFTSETLRDHALLRAPVWPRALDLAEKGAV